MGKPVIAVDVDEVLQPFTGEFIKHLNQIHGTNYDVNDMPSYWFEDLFGVTKEDVSEWISEYIKTPGYQNLGPMPGSIKAIQKLNQKFQLDIITARNKYSHSGTKEWLLKHFPATFRDVHFIRDNDNVITRTKAEVCQKIEAEILIDDSPEHIIECAKQGIRGLLFGDLPWNRAAELPENVTRVKDWDEVLRALL